MKRPVVWVTTSLMIAIVVTTTFLIATTSRGEPTSFGSSAGRLEVNTVASGLSYPWALAFLPEGRVLVTERQGRMRVVTPQGQLTPAVKGVPEVMATGQGGLLDVIADKGFAQNNTI